MYNVSNDYITAMRADSRVDDVTGTIVFPDGTSSVINTSVIGINSLKISRQCIDGDELMFGGCYLGILDVELRTDKDRYAFFGAVITLNYKVVIGIDDNDERVWETVPLGTYTVSEADRGTDANYIAVTAYDNITLLDVDWGDKSIYGTPYEILAEISNDTGLQLAFVESSLVPFPNHDTAITVNKDSGCGSYRDAVKIVAQYIGAFAQATRDGKLELRRFNTASVQTLTRSHWYNVTVSDYECHYISLFITGMRGTYHDETPNPDDFGLTMTIGDCPAFDYGVDETLATMTSNLFNYLEPIRYTPVEINMPGDPAFDCADRLSLGVGTDTAQTIITSYEWRFRDGLTIKSEGINPYLVVSDQNTTAPRIQNRIIDANKLVTYDFTNTTDIELGDEESAEVARCMIYPMQDTHVIFAATIRVHAEADSVDVPVTAKTEGGVVTPIYDGQGNPLILTSEVDGQVSAKIWYTFDGDNMGYEAIDDLSSGDHIITVVYPFNVTASRQHEWKVFMESGGGTLSLTRYTMEGVIFGQNLIEGSDFDGHIYADDEIVAVLGNGGFVVTGISESVGFDWNDVEFVNASDTVSATFSGGFIISITDSANIITQKNIYKLVSEDGTYQLISEDGEYHIESEE